MPTPPLARRKQPALPGLPPAPRRVQVTLSPQEYDTIRRLAFRTRQSQSKVIADLVAEALPVMVRVADTLDAAASLTEEARMELAAQAVAGEAKVTKLTAQALQEWGKFEAAVLAGRPEVRSAPAGRSARRRKTPGQ